jgi:putative hydrolase of the HAD superfamily
MNRLTQPLPKPAMINAVLFDLDNTLVDRNGAFRDCVYERFNIPAVRTELIQLDENGYGDREKLFSTWHRHGGNSMNQEIFGKRIAERIRPNRDLLSELFVISKTVKLGIITNGGSENQRRKFCAAGLSDVISHAHVWVSSEVGIEKPDAKIFLLASRELDELPENCVYVGDHENDFTGASAAGMRACLVEEVLDSERLVALLAAQQIS